MNIPIIGFQLLSILGLLFILGVVMVLAYVWDPIRQLPGINAVPKQTALIVGILLIIGTLAYGGVLSAPEEAEEPTDFYSVTDLTVYAYDKDDGSQLTGEMYVYEPGAEDDEYVKQTADTLRTASVSSGSVEFTGWDAEKYPEATFVYESDGGGYYQTIDTEDVRVEKDAETNTKSITIRATQYGTIDGSTTDQDPGWSDTVNDGSYNIYVENTASDTVVRNPAIEWDAKDNGSVDLLSVDDGGHIEEVDGQEYIVLDNTELEGGSVEVLSVSVDVQVSTGELDLHMDDMFAQFGADDFQTHSNVNTAGAQTYTVSW